MAGLNHHYIPRFLQRGFAVPGTGDNKIWLFERDKPPRKPRSIRSTASHPNFHSAETDDAITAEEGVLATICQRLRAGPEIVVDPAEASALVDHLAGRTAHLRQNIELGLQQLIHGIRGLLSTQDSVEKLVGLDQAAPGLLFEAQVAELAEQHPEIVALGLPREVMTRMFFFLAKEHFEDTMAEFAPLFSALTSQLLANTGDAVREGHDKALNRKRTTTPRQDLLEHLSWKIVRPPTANVILPDCVAVAVLHSAQVSPLLLAPLEETQAVLMPISSSSILVGSLHGDAPGDGYAYNDAAAVSSHRFFLAGSNGEGIQKLRALIDDRSSSSISEAVDAALSDYRAITPPEDELTQSKESPIQGERTRPGAAYELSFIDCGNSDETQQVAEIVQTIVNMLAASLPLNRLEGISFASDYQGALAAVDPNTSDTDKRSTNVGDGMVGIARTVEVRSDGAIKARIVLDWSVGQALLNEATNMASWGVGIVVRQLALIALGEIVATRLPTRSIHDPLNAYLFSWSGGLAENYIASQMASSLATADLALEDRRGLLSEAITRAQREIPTNRLAYRIHGELDVLLAHVMPQIQQVLTLSATLLGFCAGLDANPVKDGSALQKALSDAGLAAWLKQYQSDLLRVCSRLGRWESFDEFLALNIHVERLMWQFGLIPWADKEGVRVEIPFGSDAAALTALGTAELQSP